MHWFDCHLIFVVVLFGFLPTSKIVEVITFLDNGEFETTKKTTHIKYQQENFLKLNCNLINEVQHNKKQYPSQKSYGWFLTYFSSGVIPKRKFH